MDFVNAASLDCRVVTLFQVIIDHGPVKSGELVDVKNRCDVGLSATMIGANRIAINILDERLDFISKIEAV